MNLPYPLDGAEDWFELWESLMAAIDGHHFAAFEDRNLFFSGGGDWTWDAGTGSISWDDTLRLNTPLTGNPQDLAAGSETLEDGEMLVVDVSRGASSSVSLVAGVETQLTPDDAVVAICFRYGTKLYFRNGVVMTSGSSYAAFEEGVASSRPVDQRDVFTAAASQTTFTLSVSPDGDCIPLVFRQGLLMAEGASDDYQVSGDDIVFNSAVTAGHRIEVRYWT